MATSKKASTKTSTAKPTARQGARTQSKPAQGLQKAVRPSAALAAIVGQEPLPRTEISPVVFNPLTGIVSRQASLFVLNETEGAHGLVAQSIGGGGGNGGINVSGGISYGASVTRDPLNR